MEVCRTHVMAALVLMSAPAPALAQVPEPRPGGRPLFVVGAQYDARTRTTGEAGVLIPFGHEEWGDDGGFMDYRCVAALASLGPGGHRLAIGPVIHTKEAPWPWPLFLMGLDGLVTVLRTSDSPRDARPDTTYVGFEGGLMFQSVRVGLGVAHQVSGPGPHGNVFTWNVGFRVGW
jgi:hypothetical protein